MEYYKFFNLKKICEEIGFQTDKMYNNLRGKYNSFKQADKNRIANVLKPNVIEMFSVLGYDVVITRKAKQEKNEIA